MLLNKTHSITSKHHIFREIATPNGGNKFIFSSTGLSPVRDLDTLHPYVFFPIYQIYPICHILYAGIVCPYLLLLEPTSTLWHDLSQLSPLTDSFCTASRLSTQSDVAHPSPETRLQMCLPHLSYSYIFSISSFVPTSSPWPVLPHLPAP